MMMKALALLVSAAILCVANAHAEDEVAVFVPARWADAPLQPGDVARKQFIYAEHKMQFVRYEGQGGAQFDVLSIIGKGKNGSACQASAASATPVIVLRCGRSSDSLRFTRVGLELTLERVYYGARPEDKSPPPPPPAPIARVRI
jgi:hypothetical protein